MLALGWLLPGERGNGSGGLNDTEMPHYRQVVSCVHGVVPVPRLLELYKLAAPLHPLEPS